MSNFRSLHRQLAVSFTVAAVLVAVSPLASAIEPYIEYRKQVEKSESIDALKPDLMGEQVSSYDGSTRFEVTDIDLPGNNALPVRLTRSFSVELVVFSPGSPGYDSSLGGASNWTIEVPHISGTFDAAYDWEGTADGGAYAQALANKNNSLVLAATGFAMFPTTKDPDPTDNRGPYKPGNPVTLTVNSQRDGKGTPGSFAVFAPGGNGPMASGIRSATFNPETGKAQLRLAPETGTRIGRTVTVCADKGKCG